MVGKAWSTDEVATLHELRGVRGWDAPTIGKAMGRSARSIRCKIRSEGIVLPLCKRRGLPVSQDLSQIIRQAFNDGVQVMTLAREIERSKEFVRSAYASLGRELHARPVAVVGSYMGFKEMAAIAAPICGVTPKAALSGLRTRPAVLARMAVAMAMRDKGLSFTVIGNALGGRDHSTAINLIERAPYYAKLYPELMQAYQAIKDAQQAVRLAA